MECALFVTSGVHASRVMYIADLSRLINFDSDVD